MVKPTRGANSIIDTNQLTPEQAADILCLSRRKFASKYKVGYRVWRRLRTQYDGVMCDPPTADEDFETLFTAVAAHAEAQRTTDPDQTFHAVHWGNKPCGLLWTADWHVGSQWCDYIRLRTDLEEIGAWRREHGLDALHLAHGGDGWDGYLTGNAARSGLYETTETRVDRQELLFLGLAKLAGSWDFLLYGCHPSWTLTQAGRDSLAPLAKELLAVDGGFGMEVEVTVGAQQYRLVLRHKARGESSLNTTNVQRRMDDDFGCGPAGERADVVALAHLHNTDLQKRTKAGRRVVYLRAGSYKGGTIYDRGIGATLHKDTADFGNPLVIFLPEEHRIIPFAGDDWREGLALLSMLRDD